MTHKIIPFDFEPAEVQHALVDIEFRYAMEDRHGTNSKTLEELKEDVGDATRKAENAAQDLGMLRVYTEIAGADFTKGSAIRQRARAVSRLSFLSRPDAEAGFRAAIQGFCCL